MISVTVETTVERAEWDGQLSRTGAGNIFQTARWAAYQQAYLGSEPYFIRLNDRGKTVGQLVVVHGVRGQESLRGNAGTAAARVMAPMLDVCSWRNGPVLA